MRKGIDTWIVLHPTAARVGATVGAILSGVALVLAAVVALVRLDPLSRYPFSTRRVVPTPAAVADPGARFNTDRIHDRMSNAGMVALYTTPGDEPIYVTVTADAVVLRIGRPQDVEAALALVPLLFADDEAGRAAQSVARAVIEAGCNDAQPAGDVMVTAQMIPAAGAAMCAVTFA